MNLKSIIRNFASRDWLLALFILGIYLLTNRYIYGWDDQHLEIPLLKHLIDPALYNGDYYVEGLTRNFTSFFYPILAKLIKVDQIPSVYLFLFLISRYFLFYWWLKLWRLLAVRSQLGTGKEKNTALIAVSCVLYGIVLGRTEEFLYRTFSHQEFALAIVFAGVYFFFKDRYILASLLLGFAANFHAIYALFPMAYMCFYLLLFHHKKNFEYCFKAGVTFLLTAMPFILWTLLSTFKEKSAADPNAFKDWMHLYILACPQNFPFTTHTVAEVLSDGTMLKFLGPFLVLASLYLYNHYANDHFRQDRKIRAISICCVILIAACFFFTYVVPSRISLNLNLIRNEQFLRFFLLGYLVISAVRMIQIKDIFWAILAGVVFIAASRKDFFGAVPLNIAIALMIYLKSKNPHWEKSKPIMHALIVVLMLLSILQVLNIDWKEISALKWNNPFWLLLLPFLYAAIPIYSGKTQRGRIVLVLLPILLMIGNYLGVHYKYYQLSTKGDGFWQMQRNWEDMQQYVQKNTPKDAMLLIPYNMEMCGFRIQSERKILVSYRDCGIIGFDYLAAKEWERRIADIQEFKTFVDPRSIGPAIVTALVKYKVDYIVFMRYYAPGDNNVVRKIYENDVFALYQVIKKP